MGRRGVVGLLRARRFGRQEAERTAIGGGVLVECRRKRYRPSRVYNRRPAVCLSISFDVVSLPWRYVKVPGVANQGPAVKRFLAEFIIVRIRWGWEGHTVSGGRRIETTRN